MNPFIPAMTPITLIVEGNYQLDLRLGGGSYGEVYLGHHVETGEEVALKLEHEDDGDPSQLDNEVEIYKQLAGGTGIPQVYWYGWEGDYRVMAFELLGPSLDDLFSYCSQKFSLKTVLLLADQLIPCLQYIHSKGYIHRDIKPDNLLMGVGKRGNTVYVADFGLAKDIERQLNYTYPMIGTLRYASIKAHEGEEQSPREDMESLGYIFLYFLKGSLPWQGLKLESKENEMAILNKKREAKKEGLFNDVPVEFKEYFELLRSENGIDYGRLQSLFRGLFHRNHFEYDNVFDWTILKFLDEQEAKQDTSEPKQDTSELEQDISEPEHDTLEPEQDTSEPEHDTSEPEHDTSEAKQDTPEAQQAPI